MARWVREGKLEKMAAKGYVKVIENKREVTRNDGFETLMEIPEKIPIQVAKPKKYRRFKIG